MSKIKFLSASLVTATLIFSGCGSSDDSSSTTPTTVTQTGSFVDAPVQGLSYQTATQSGFTDANGTFKYVTGETVEFKLGNLSLGKGTAGTLITPYTIADTNDTAINIALLLQNFDGNRSDLNALDLSKLKDYNFTASDFNLSAAPATMKGKIDTLFADNNFAQYRDDMNNTVLSETDVKSAMDEYINKITTNDDITSIIDNEYSLITYSKFVGSKYEGIVKFTSNNKIIFVGTTDEANFEKVNNTTLKMIWDQDDIEYFHFLTATKDYATICSTRDLNAKCVDSTIFLTNNNDMKNTLLDKTSIFTNPTSVTTLDELRGKVLYELGSTDQEDIPFNFYAKRLESDNTLTTFAWNIDPTTDHELNLDRAWTQTEGSLSINTQGKIVNSEDEDHQEGYSVVKYSLKDKTISLNELKNDGHGFDNSDTPDINGTVTFTKGNIYCHYIYDECWLDQDGIDQFKTAFYQFNPKWYQQ